MTSEAQVSLHSLKLACIRNQIRVQQTIKDKVHTSEVTVVKESILARV